ncbi:MAG: hypothetical protein A3F95_02075 [Candidatus Nealsonbacteria bacterium RIFCSPLOWO2_12_FULL_39_31]|uniref:Uncharacterized protein n=3 Tax=Candidatus Nealsoniibacteriota TaxID=1817911 RepID=A0A1G2EGF1_9BACT|nr:MAG: hypothetical protein A2626_01920 [Candidatus Nealsonbacteria bacterium RIFCSPHIGHO2_01_FULL_38_55]OGZ20921.1 MAG: hypothetical protein A3C48_03060 [Candidatus Nealsonbacteria bacterium RIFCSPHIGHO2_02_FULL_38_75]OGZ21016.1 MAG: hypothetical protein A2W55_02360 [Candidatus Nealsonbacteria bacterium RIFCSPHIGHO2_02_38_10]OGZ22833.1 MAG: hypothetical protein A3E18_00115 [Candidatus Nealsonbacteria bacterium RIFCSPHIGHO2_12_FULL_38_18]OGZ23780.1 MAG: hypothetical protein A2981_02290 [Candid
MDNLFNYLPIIILLMAFFSVFFIFIFGVLILLKSVGDEQEERRARYYIILSFYSLIAISIAVLVFFLVTYLIRRGETFLPPQSSGDFPVSPLSEALPSQPEFIGINGYYFSVPAAIKNRSSISGPAFFAVFCRVGEKYDIIQIGNVSKGNKAELLEGNNYKCWLTNCQNNIDNIFVSAYFFSFQAYEADNFEKMETKLKGYIVSPCSGN